MVRRTGGNDLMQLYDELTQGGRGHLMSSSISLEEQVNRRRMYISSMGSSSGTSENSSQSEYAIAGLSNLLSKKERRLVEGVRDSVWTATDEKMPDRKDYIWHSVESNPNRVCRRAHSMEPVETRCESLGTDMRPLEDFKRCRTPTDICTQPFNGVTGGRLDSHERSPYCDRLLLSPCLTMTQRLFFCWICETQCAGLGWSNASDLYSAEEKGSCAGRGVPVSLLTLCTRCTAACSHSANIPLEVVLQMAGATRARMLRSEMFVTAVREYKLLLDVFSSNFRKGLMRDSSAQTQSVGLSFWDLGIDVQQDMVHRLMKMLANTLEINSLALQNGDNDVLSMHERSHLEDELLWLQQHLVRIENLKSAGNQSDSKAHYSENGHLKHSERVHSSFSQMSPTIFRGLSQRFQRSLQSPMDTQRIARDPQICSRKIGVGNQQEQAEQGGLVVIGEQQPLEALGHMLDRAFAWRIRNGTNDSSKKMEAGREAVIVAGRREGGGDVQTASGASAIVNEDADNILMRYFEGRVEDLPRFRLLTLRAERGGNNCSDVPQAPRGQLNAIIESNRGRDTCQETRDVPRHVAVVSADVIDATEMNSASLLDRLHEEQRRRTEAEDAFLESQRKIAALEKVTDHMSELILEHRMSSTLAHHLSTMQHFFSAMVRNCVDITLQKSLFFSDEMSVLMRQVQRRVYGVPMLFPKRHVDPVLLAEMISREESKISLAVREKEVVLDEAVRDDLRMNISGNDCGKRQGTSPTPSPPNMFPLLLELKPLVHGVPERPV